MYVYTYTYMYCEYTWTETASAAAIANISTLSYIPLVCIPKTHETMQLYGIR